MGEARALGSTHARRRRSSVPAVTIAERLWRLIVPDRALRAPLLGHRGGAVHLLEAAWRRGES